MTPDPRTNEPDIGVDVGPTGRGPTRRRVLALAGGTAAVVGATMGPFSNLFVSGAAEGDGPPEITLSSWLIGIELAAQKLYETVADSTAFDPSTQALAATCGSHHGAQASALGAMVSAGGGQAPTTPNAAFVDENQGKIDGAADGAAKAGVFADMENGFAATYFATLDTVTSAPLATVVAQVLATDGAHAVAWAAAAAGQGSDNPLPPPDAIPAEQTDTGQFEQSTSSTPTTTTGAAS